MGNIIKTAIVGLLLSLFCLEASAQSLSKDQCISSVRARTFRLDATQIEQLCANNPYPVVNCVITKIQGTNSTAKLDDYSKSCTLETIPRRYRKKLEVKPTPTPAPTVTVPVEEVTAPPADDAAFEEI